MDRVVLFHVKPESDIAPVLFAARIHRDTFGVSCRECEIPTVDALIKTASILVPSGLVFTRIGDEYAVSTDGSRDRLILPRWSMVYELLKIHVMYSQECPDTWNNFDFFVHDNRHVWERDYRFKGCRVEDNPLAKLAPETFVPGESSEMAIREAKMTATCWLPRK